MNTVITIYNTIRTKKKKLTVAHVLPGTDILAMDAGFSVPGALPQRRLAGCSAGWSVVLELLLATVSESSVESSSVLRGMLDKDFLEQNERGIEPFMGKYANFVIAVDDVTVESSDFVYFNHKLKYVVSMSVNGFMGETVSKASES